MSFQAMSWAVGQKCQNAGEKLVLLMLANYCNTHTGRCNPSHKRLAEECAMGISTLKRHIARLEKGGLLAVVAMSADGVSLPNQYDLCVQTGGGGSKSGGGSAQIGPGVGPNRATNLELNQEQKHSSSSDAAPRRQQVPTQDVIDAYNATMTRLAKVRALTSKRKRAIEAAWKSSPLAGDVELFREYFEECETDAFLSGVGPYGNGHENWRPDFDYLMRPDVIAKTYEKAMDAIEREARQ